MLTQHRINNWKKSQIGAIGKYLNGFAFKTSSWTNTGYPIIRIQNLNDPKKPFNYFNGNVPEKYIVRRNDILVSWSASLGTYRWNHEMGFLNQHIFKAIPNLEIVNKDFFYWVLVYSIDGIAKEARGSTMKSVTKYAFDNYEIDLPPLNEQKDISNYLSTIERAIFEQESLQNKLNELKRNTMQHLFTKGTKNEKTKITDIGEMPESWDNAKLGDLWILAQYGLSKKGSEKGNSPMLRMTNQKDGYINIDKLQHIEISEKEIEKFKINKNDVIFNRTNSLELVGRTAIYKYEMNNVVFASYLIRIKTKEDILLPDYLNYYFNHQETQKRLKSIATRGVSQSNISASRLSTFAIPLPSISEQESIIRVLESVNRKMMINQSKLILYKSIFKTLLHELMSGERRINQYV
jgi:type I restriction enzyme S subunit